MVLVAYAYAAAATHIFHRGSFSQCWGPIPGVLESSFFCSQLQGLRAATSGIFGHRVDLQHCWSCRYVEDALVDSDKQLAAKDKRKAKASTSPKKGGRRKNTQIPAVATEELETLSPSMTLDELSLRNSLSALLESAYRQPAFEPVLLRSLERFHGVEEEQRALSMDLVSQPLIVKHHKKRRLGLESRMALHRERVEKLAKDRAPLASEEVETPAKVSAPPGCEFDPWSQEAEVLIKEYGASGSMLVLNWDKLPRLRLTGPEEVRLAWFMAPAKRLQQVRLKFFEHLKREPSEEEWAKVAEMSVQTLRRLLQLGQAARNKMIKHNLRLVAHQARKYFKEELSLSLLDLCQEGVPGLMSAVDKFDPKKGYRFSTYAVYWVKNSILRAQTRLGHIVRVPYNVAAQKMTIQRKRAQLSLELDREPTHEEVITELKMDSRRYFEVLRTGAPRRSLNARSKVTGEELIHSISDPDENEAQYFNAGAQLRLGMDDVLDSLKPKESLIIRQRYGLDGKGERSFTEIGRNLNLSREMVRKYEIRGMMKLKHPTRVKYLREFLL
ncbi:RNA polymerase sigma factor sigE, chloroplastic/mitochondrial isoform X1 [Selaginella moellendorffii]|nr:RNA polymerase sigma factor sigE, chloroplastic/mitochondrial isoform X1 [Selaginella moellendorffii]|eukprot:XP_002977925.2 RNA polymerase sigma factor sigE, chloroplastic/mitochondrial isoform X1 [Selaginella moellendorffii]